MASIAASYLGLSLSSPVILSSSSLTGTVNGALRAVEAGAGAVVLKSLFEEQIEADEGLRDDSIDYTAHPEAGDYIEQMGKLVGAAGYLSLIAEVRRAVTVPVIASVNCVSERYWGDYGRQLELAGAHAVELNVAMMPREADSAALVEEHAVRIVESVRRQVSLPIAVKIGPYFTALRPFCARLVDAGASGLVLFNRFYQFDIDTDRLALTGGYQFSAPQEIHVPLRWISILAGRLDGRADGRPGGARRVDLAASTGVVDGNDAVKLLLAGAAAVQVCSTVYQNGYERIRQINDEITAWMKKHGFQSIDQFRGRLSQANSNEPERYERLQYIKALTGIS